MFLSLGWGISFSFLLFHAFLARLHIILVFSHFASIFLNFSHLKFQKDFIFFFSTFYFCITFSLGHEHTCIFVICLFSPPWMPWNRFIVIVSLLVQDLVAIPHIEPGPLGSSLGLHTWDQLLELKGVSDHGQVVFMKNYACNTNNCRIHYSNGCSYPAVYATERITLDHV